MGEVDLHIHSIYSDGTKTPEELYNLAKEKGIKTMAITDHNNINGSKELRNLNKKEITIYSGVELTSKVKKGSRHILGYNFDLENEALNNRLNEMRESSIYNMHLYIDVLKKDFDINIPQEYLDELFNSKGRIGRPQLAIILIKMNLVKSVAEAFNRYLLYAYEKNKKVNQTLSEEECLDLINRAGGIAILAHPNSLLLDDVEIEEEIKRLCSMGLKGLETTHSDLNLKERELYHHLALKYNLLESGGTDYHGLEIKPDILLGSGRNNNVSIKENTLTLTKKIKSRYM